MVLFRSHTLTFVSLMRLPMLALGFALVSPSSAQITTFMDLGSWTGAAGSPTAVEDFESFIDDEDFNDIAVPLAFGTMNAVSGGTSTFRNVIDVTPFQFGSVNGTNCVSGFVNGSAAALPFVQIEFDLLGTASAFAFSYDVGALAEGLTVDFSSGGTVIGSVDVTAVLPPAGFVGFTSSQTFDLVIFRASIPLAGSGGEGLAFDDVLVVGSSGSLGTRYCSPGNVNSTGLPGVITVSGSENAAQNNVVLTASMLPRNAFGFFVVSQVQGFVPNPAGSQGNLCLAGSIGRYVGAGQILNAGQAGEFSLPLDLTMTPQPAGFVSIAAGETWNFQGWHRDGIGGVATSNFTDAVSVVFL